MTVVVLLKKKFNSQKYLLQERPKNSTKFFKNPTGRKFKTIIFIKILMNLGV